MLQWKDLNGLWVLPDLCPTFTQCNNLKVDLSALTKTHQGNNKVRNCIQLCLPVQKLSRCRPSPKIEFFKNSFGMLLEGQSRLSENGWTSELNFQKKNFEVLLYIWWFNYDKAHNTWSFLWRVSLRGTTTQSHRPWMEQNTDGFVLQLDLKSGPTSVF